MKSSKSEITRRGTLVPMSFDDIFEAFRRDLENAFFFPSLLDKRNQLDSDFEARLPICDMVDLGDKYEVTLEIPGIPKEQVAVKAGIDYIDISGEQEKKKEEKKKNYLHNERSYSSLSRHISTPEEIIPSKIDAKMENGVLRIQVPKKTPTKTEETKVQIK